MLRVLVVLLAAAGACVAAAGIAVGGGMASENCTAQGLSWCSYNSAYNNRVCYNSSTQTCCSDNYSGCWQYTTVCNKTATCCAPSYGCSYGGQPSCCEKGYSCCAARHNGGCIRDDWSCCTSGAQGYSYACSPGTSCCVGYWSSSCCTAGESCCTWFPTGNYQAQTQCCSASQHCVPQQVGGCLNNNMTCNAKPSMAISGGSILRIISIWGSNANQCCDACQMFNVRSRDPATSCVMAVTVMTNSTGSGVKQLCHIYNASGTPQQSTSGDSWLIVPASP